MRVERALHEHPSDYRMFLPYIHIGTIKPCFHTPIAYEAQAPALQWLHWLICSHLPFWHLICWAVMSLYSSRNARRPEVQISGVTTLQGQTYNPVVVTTALGTDAGAGAGGVCVVRAVSASHGGTGEAKSGDDAEELHVAGALRVGEESC